MRYFATIECLATYLRRDTWHMACIAVKDWALMSAACISLHFSP